MYPCCLWIALLFYCFRAVKYTMCICRKTWAEYHKTLSFKSLHVTFSRWSYMSRIAVNLKARTVSLSWFQEIWNPCWVTDRSDWTTTHKLGCNALKKKVSMCSILNAFHRLCSQDPRGHGDVCSQTQAGGHPIRRHEAQAVNLHRLNRGLSRGGSGWTHYRSRSLLQAQHLGHCNPAQEK